VGVRDDRAGGSAPPDSSQREDFYQGNREGQRLQAREVKILHLSDMHASVVVGLKYLEEAVELGVAQKPDVVCLTGDFITTTYGKFAEYGRVLKKLSAAAPAFACMGNHDGGKWIGRWGYPTWSLVGEMLKGAGIKVLHNAAERVDVNGRKVQLVGVGDMWAQELDAVKAFREVEKGLPTVLLSHNPDTKSVVEGFGWDLMLSGHTHGGQCCLPFFGAPFAPLRDKRYVAGLKEWKGRWIHVTKGVGNLHGVRFNCRPEVSLVRVIV
jgi:uncharacterized protein